MQISFTQVYIEGGVSFPFSHLFQHRLSEALSALAEPSALFLKHYGADLEFIFYISAKDGIQDNEIRGPTVFRKAKDVEYTVFLPFDVVMRHDDAPRYAVILLLKGICEVFDRLKIDKAPLLDKQESIIESICSDPTMLGAPSWD